jgi:hypothetical protein
VSQSLPSGKELVEFDLHGFEDRFPLEAENDPMRLIDVTGYRTEQEVVTTRWQVPAAWDQTQINQYINATLAYVGFWEIFHQERFQTDYQSRGGEYYDEEPADGFEWKETAE